MMNKLLTLIVMIGVFFTPAYTRGYSGGGGGEHENGSLVVTTNRQVITEGGDITLNFYDNRQQFHRYEVKLIPLDYLGEAEGQYGKFVEAQSPFTFEHIEHVGQYDAVVRAINNSGEIHESAIRFEVVPLFQFVAATVLMRGENFPSTTIFLIMFLGFMVILGIHIRTLSMLHHKMPNEVHETEEAINYEGIRKELGEIRNTYHITHVLGIVMFAGSMAISLSCGSVAYASVGEGNVLSPQIHVYPKEIGNDQYFYMEGIATAKSQVVMFLVSSDTQIQVSRSLVVGDNAVWSFRLDEQLPAGNYSVWAKTRLYGSESPPTAPLYFRVAPRSLPVFGGTIRFETLFELFLLACVMAVGLLVLYLRRTHDGYVRRKNAFAHTLDETKNQLMSEILHLEHTLDKFSLEIQHGYFVRGFTAEHVGSREGIKKDIALLTRHKKFLSQKHKKRS